MFRKLSIALLGSVFLPVSAMAQDSQSPQSGFYIQGAVGHSLWWDLENDDSDDTDYDLLAFFISGAVGYRLSPNFRAEAEILYESADDDEFDTEDEVTRWTLNGYYDFAQTPLLGIGATPYVGAGAGIANIDSDGGFDDENEFTFHAEAGLSVPIFDQVEFVPGFRFEYIFLDDDDFNTDDDLWITQLRAGLRYNF